MGATAILDDDVVRLIVRETPKHLGAPFASMIQGNERHFENTIRYKSLSEKCRQTRESAGISLKQLAVELKIPQYRIRAIEEGRFGEIRYADLNGYLATIGLEKWYKKWAKANPSLAKDLSEGKAGWSLLKKIRNAGGDAPTQRH